MAEQVNCPICNTSVPETDINLHLDLQCKGVPPRSTAKVKSPAGETLDITESPPSTQSIYPPSSSRSSQDRKTPSRRIILERTSSGGKEKSVAPIFGTQSTKRKSETRDVKPILDSREKKPKQQRVNPLEATRPLAERSRPADISQYVGQTDIVGSGSLLRAQMEAGKLVGSCVLWGPPGCGKTTLARLIARSSGADFKELSATSSGTQDVRQVFEKAKNGLMMTGRRTVLLIDEIHRFNRPQQDLLLPYVEKGWIQLIGATTENPSFKVNGALLSRCQVFTLQPHSPESLVRILQNAVESISKTDPIPYIPPELISFLADIADGDARQALNGLELALKTCEAMDSLSKAKEPASEPKDDADREIAAAERVDEQEKRDKAIMDAVRKGLQKGYNRTGEERYDMISALHKCLRGSDGSAAMYWLARMITGGEDALYIARRLVVVASEDVGLADNHALPLAMATYQACQTIGLPECRLNLAHCVAYLAEAPKSTRAYVAYKSAESLANTPPLPGVPMQIRNAPTKLMKTLGYGKEYAYNPNYAHPVHNEYLPESLSQHSSLTGDPAMHILKTDEEYEESKVWDDRFLEEWEKEVNGGWKWDGRGDPS